MSDYSACSNSSCPSRANCYRYRLVWHEFWQSVASYKLDPATGSCPALLSIEHRRVVSLEEADAREARMRAAL